MIKAVELKEFVSKNGNTYKALEITFINGYKKKVFLEPSELYMLETLTK